ncbi:MAG: phosphate acyltransferase [Chthoniobacterales bacterium]|nr:phosphate acyltransferase [Chthoniobacterales bacterium]
MSFTDSIYEKLRRHPKRIVFPDGDDPRVLWAAQEFYRLRLGVPILLGNKEVVHAVAEAHSIRLDHVMIIDPETASDMPMFCRYVEKLERYRKMGLKDPREILLNRNYFAAAMLQHGVVDGLVGGISTYSGSLLRPLIQLVKPLDHAEVISSCTIVELPNKPNIGDNGVLFFADCAVVPEPTMHQLAVIAVEAGLLARQVFGTKPRVAMLSYSTKGSAQKPNTQKVAGATELARALAKRLGVEMEIDGEMQADTALAPDVARVKSVISPVAGNANVLIFPNLDSGNIALKLVQYLADAQIYGQIITGLTRPAAELSRGTLKEDIVKIAAVIGIQAVEYRKLYPNYS